jgi:hypothetical protein
MRRFTRRALAAAILGVMTCLQLSAVAPVAGSPIPHPESACHALTGGQPASLTNHVEPAAIPDGDAPDDEAVLDWLMEDTLPGLGSSATPVRQEADVLSSPQVCYTGPSLGHPTRPPKSA